MIPKIIHYCWFGGKPKPPLLERCIRSWKRFCPDYLILEWNENNFHVEINRFCNIMYLQKRYAFVSDCARWYILEHMGGISFDTDVELTAPIDDLLDCRGILCYEDAMRVNPGSVCAFEPHHPIAQAHVRKYEEPDLASKKMTYLVSPWLTTPLLEQFGFMQRKGMQEILGVRIYPRDWFCPANPITGIALPTKNTRAIHRFRLSWWSKQEHLDREAKTAVIFVQEYCGQAIASCYGMIQEAKKTDFPVIIVTLPCEESDAAHEQEERLCEMLGCRYMKIDHSYIAEHGGSVLTALRNFFEKIVHFADLYLPYQIEKAENINKVTALYRAIKRCCVCAYQAVGAPDEEAEDEEQRRGVKYYYELSDKCYAEKAAFLRQYTGEKAALFQSTLTRRRNTEAYYDWDRNML